MLTTTTPTIEGKKIIACECIWRLVFQLGTHCRLANLYFVFQGVER